MLLNVTIPDSVTSIGESAFFGCESLASIYFKGTASKWQLVILLLDREKDVPATEVICSDGTIKFN